MSLMCLGSGNGLQIMGDFFEITKSIISFQWLWKSFGGGGGGAQNFFKKKT
jgi:hypothetical protein